MTKVESITKLNNKPWTLHRAIEQIELGSRNERRSCLRRRRTGNRPSNPTIGGGVAHNELLHRLVASRVDEAV